jgi:hypothetical protein
MYLKQKDIFGAMNREFVKEIKRYFLGHEQGICKRNHGNLSHPIS